MTHTRPNFFRSSLFKGEYCSSLIPVEAWCPLALNKSILGTATGTRYVCLNFWRLISVVNGSQQGSLIPRNSTLTKSAMLPPWCSWGFKSRWEHNCFLRIKWSPRKCPSVHLFQVHVLRRFHFGAILVSTNNEYANGRHNPPGLAMNLRHLYIGGLPGHVIAPTLTNRWVVFVHHGQSDNGKLKSTGNIF